MKTIVCILIITINTLLVTNSVAQHTKIDSLRNLLPVTKNDSALAHLYYDIGLTFIDIQKDSAINYLQDALTKVDDLSIDVTSPKNKDLLYVKTYSFFYIGYALMRTEYEESIKNFEKSQELNQDLKDKKLEASLFYNLALTYGNIQQQEKSIHYNLKSADAYYKLDRKTMTLISFNRVGASYKELGNYQDAIYYYNKSLEVSKEIDHQKGIASAIHNIGDIYRMQGNFHKAISKLEEAVELNTGSGNKFYLATNYNSIGIIYFYLENMEKAIEYFQKSLGIYEEIDYKEGMAWCYTNIGNVYAKYGQKFPLEQSKPKYDSALLYYNLSEKIYNDKSDLNDLSQTIINVGSIHYLLNDFKKADECYYEALKITGETKNKDVIISALNGISKNKISLADKLKNVSSTKKGEAFNSLIDSALYYAQSAYQMALEIGAVRHQSETLQDIQIASWGLGKINDASQYFDIQNSINNKEILMNFSFISEKEKEMFFQSIQDDFWRYYSFALMHKESKPEITESVYNNDLKNKGLLLKSNTAMRNAVYNSQDSSLIKLYDEWIICRRQIANKYSRGEDIKDLESKANNMEADLVRKSGEFSDFNKVQNINWKMVQTNLQKGEAAIEFIHFPLFNPDSSLTDFTDYTQYAALVIKKNSMYPEMIPLFKEKQLEEIIGKFGGNNYSYINGIYGKNNEANKKLYNLIWKPLENELSEVKTIYLSPSGLLHKISFSAIATDLNTYLCDAYNIEIKSSTGKLLEKHNFHISTATLFGGIMYDTDSTDQKIWKYLEGSESEVQKIDKILKKNKINVNYYSNSLATEDEFKQIASNSNIIHIATHGFFYPDPEQIEQEEEKYVESADVVFRGGSIGFGVSSFVKNRNPLMRSGLVFAGANDVWSRQSKNDSLDDGVLAAQEVANIDMRNTVLVVMSACETGLGDIKGSEGVYGLQRAFKMAGVNYIIMSLWQVPDKETEEFMTLFYKKLVKQKDIKQAFTQTQKEMRQKYDPYFWAAFVLVE